MRHVDWILLAKNTNQSCCELLEIWLTVEVFLCPGALLSCVNCTKVFFLSDRKLDDFIDQDKLFRCMVSLRDYITSDKDCLRNWDLVLGARGA
jgi:hypothetical protein